MAITIKHAFQSAKADGVDLTLVQPSNWNDNHTITMGTGKFLGRVSSGTGAVEELTLSDYSVPTGTIVPHAKPGNTPPAGWSLCDGSVLSRTTEAALFAEIGTTYGVGDGSTTFNKPDLRGRAIFGRNDMGGSASSVLVFTGSNASGTKFGAQNHTHSGSGLAGTGSGITVASSTGFNDGIIVFASGGGGQASQNSHTHTIPPLTVNVTSLTISGSTGNQDNLPPGMIMNWIIKL